MREFNLRFSMDSASFADGNARAEAILLLAQLCARLSHGEDTGIIRDTNGNRIGQWSADWP